MFLIVKYHVQNFYQLLVIVHGNRKCDTGKHVVFIDLAGCLQAKIKRTGPNYLCRFNLSPQSY